MCARYLHTGCLGLCQPALLDRLLYLFCSLLDMSAHDLTGDQPAMLTATATDCENYCWTLPLRIPCASDVAIQLLSIPTLGGELTCGSLPHIIPGRACVFELLESPVRCRVCGILTQYCTDLAG